MRKKYVVPVLAALTLFDVVGATANAQEDTFNSSYVGGALGYQNTDIDAFGDSGDTDRFMGGAFAGHNFRFGNLVLGIEAGVYGSEKERFELTAIDGSVVMSGIQGEARGRVGFLVSNTVMIYGAGGAAIADQEVENLDEETSEDETIVGLTVGGGFEAVITGNVTGRLDVSYTDFGDETLLGEDVDTSSTTVKVGFALNF